MAVNYNAGASSAMAAQYADLRNAIASRDSAENLRRTEDIERQGLLGTGIRTSDIQDLGNLAIKGAAFGDARMERKMDRARASFDRRMKADERRLKTLQQRWKTADPESRANLMQEMEGIEMGMGERRNSFEDHMGRYQEKGLWGTSFGGDDVGYRTEGESKWSRGERSKVGSGNGDGDQGGMALSADTEHMRQAKAPMGERSFHDPDAVPDWRQGQIRPIRQAGSMGPEEGFLDFGKKKVDGTSGQELRDIASEKDTAHMRAQQDPTAWRSNFYKEKPSDMRMPGVLRNLTQNQRDRMDVLERERVVREDLAPLNEAKAGEAQMIQDILNKRKRNKIEDLVAGLNLKG